MGLIDSFMKGYNTAEEARKRHMTVEEYEAQQRAKVTGRKVAKTGYSPKKDYDSSIQSSIYNTYGTNDLDKWFEQGAPHLTDAIYEVRDGVKSIEAQQQEYDDLKEHYEKLEKSYNELQGRFDKMTNLLETIAKNTSR